MSITSSKISFGTQFKAHIKENRAALHLRLKKLEKEQKKEKDVQGILTSTVRTVGVSANPTGCFERQHPPFFSKMRTFFKNRPPWLKF
jgi:hypothetical protein